MRRHRFVVGVLVALLGVAGCGVTAQSTPVPLTETSSPPVLVPTVTHRPGPAPQSPRRESAPGPPSASDPSSAVVTTSPPAVPSER
jgi:hypothetical protein